MYQCVILEVILQFQMLINITLSPFIHNFMSYNFSSKEFTSPLNLPCFCFNILVVKFIISTFTLTLSNLDLFFLTTDVYLSSFLCSTVNSISLFIFSFICCPGFNSSSPTINITAVIIPKQPCVCTSHYIYIMIVRQRN